MCEDNRDTVISKVMVGLPLINANINFALVCCVSSKTPLPVLFLQSVNRT